MRLLSMVASVDGGGSEGSLISWVYLSRVGGLAPEVRCDDGPVDADCIVVNVLRICKSANLPYPKGEGVILKVTVAAKLDTA